MRYESDRKLLPRLVAFSSRDALSIPFFWVRATTAPSFRSVAALGLFPLCSVDFEIAFEKRENSYESNPLYQIGL